MHPYKRFVAMTLTSTVVMFALMYVNTFSWDHVYFSQTRAFMALIMGAAMAGVMLLFMRRMYPNQRRNIGILGTCASILVLSLWLLRSQRTVDDVAWMKAMIPHHSIAILTSERAHLADPRVRTLSDQIIEAQRREIGEMQALIRELSRK